MNRQTVERMIRDMEFNASQNRVAYRGRVMPLRASDGLHRAPRPTERNLTIHAIAVASLAGAAIWALVFWGFTHSAVLVPLQTIMARFH